MVLPKNKGSSTLFTGAMTFGKWISDQLRFVRVDASRNRLVVCSIQLRNPLRAPWLSEFADWREFFFSKSLE